MKGNVLVLGAGLVARPLVRYLLDREYHVTVASRTIKKAEALIEGHEHGKALAWTVDQTAELSQLIANSDLAVSLLPAPFHPTVAKECIKASKHMVTTSYVSPEMKGLDQQAKEAGVIVLNEIGVDPGIDHMSIMKVIDDVGAKKGRLTALRSCCGGLPAPEANTNPLGYKFSWSPAGVLVAMTGQALFLEDGKKLDLEVGGIFDHVHNTKVRNLGELEYYPNRNSLQYIEIYGLEGISTMYRGTFRYPGWCGVWNALFKVGLLDRTPREGLEGRTFAQLLGDLVGSEPGPGLRAKVAEKGGITADDPAMDKVEWLGMLGDEKMGAEGTYLDVVSGLLLRKMAYQPGERDMLIMKHDFEAEYPDGSREAIVSTMLDFGIPNGDSSMARTVSLPAAIAVRHILEGNIAEKGVHVPVIPQIYKPVLAELEELKITLEEEHTPIK